MELLETDTIMEVREKILAETSAYVPKVEMVPFTQALGRICAEDVIAREPVPPFRRSTMDGYAVLASDTFGAGDASPVFLQVDGQVAIEENPRWTVGTNHAVQVQTGGRIPEGATAVVMLEYTEKYMPGHIIVTRPVSEGENIAAAGEDISLDQCLIRRGKSIGAGDIGMLAAQGIRDLAVFKPLRVAVISTGDELIDVEGTPSGAKIRDINSHSLTALAVSCGMAVTWQTRVGDHEEEIIEALRYAKKLSDVVLISGGSSKGSKDYTKKALEAVTENVFSHGISVKPGKPTILAADRKTGKLFVGLPGHPMAAVLMFHLLVVDWYRKVTGQTAKHPYPARLTENVSSNQGRATCLPVRLVPSPEGYGAAPIHGKSGSISPLGLADGYIIIPESCEGLTCASPVFVEVLA